MTDRPVVLVVEDEPIIRVATAFMLEDSGFDTLEAQNGTEAIAILEHRDDVALVFTDIDLGDTTDGAELLFRIARRWPPIILFATSGVHAGDNRSQLPEKAHFFAKPYDQRLVIEAFNLALAE